MSFRTYLRSQNWWINIRELQREGFADAFARLKVQKLILNTAPISTEKSGDVEIRVLTWRRDYLNLLWALKSFYHFSPKKYPLYIHDGGLLEHQKKILNEHFPNAYIISKEEGNLKVESFLLQQGFNRSIEYRRTNIATVKVWDYFILSQAKEIIHIDSDILFFKYPKELLESKQEKKSNLFNRDCAEAYSLSPSEIMNEFSISVPPLINSGLFRVASSSMDWSLIDTLLKNQKIFSNKWVTEQTLHAINSAIYGVDFLSELYQVSTKRTELANLVCKHYPGFFRPLFYQEGINHLLELNFLVFK